MRQNQCGTRSQGASIPGRAVLLKLFDLHRVTSPWACRQKGQKLALHSSVQLQCFLVLSVKLYGGTCQLPPSLAVTVFPHTYTDTHTHTRTHTHTHTHAHTHAHTHTPTVQKLYDKQLGFSIIYQGITGDGGEWGLLVSPPVECH